MKFAKSLLAGAALLASGCTSAKVEDYAGRTPPMDIRQYLNGDIDAWGVFMNRSGMVEKQFHVAMQCTWKGNEGRLEEHFNYTDGKTESRVWSVHFTDDNHFTANAHDVIGDAIGSQFGNAVNMKYVLRIPTEGTTYDISMNDWIYKMTDDTAINHVEMSKFGVKVGDLFITFKKKK